jgi:uncharacterized protein YraI
MTILRSCIAGALALGLSTIAAQAEYVCNLNPYGDNFLSLRNGPGSSYGEIDRLGENTVLTVTNSRGPWLYVQTRNSGAGWVHRRWVCGGYPR